MLTGGGQLNTKFGRKLASPRHSKVQRACSPRRLIGLPDPSSTRWSGRQFGGIVAEIILPGQDIRAEVAAGQLPQGEERGLLMLTRTGPITGGTLPQVPSR